MPKAAAGSLMAVMSLGILAGSLVFGPVVDRFGYRPVLVAGALGVGLGLASIAWAPAPALLTPAMLMFGCCGGLLNGATNALVADITPEGRESGLALLGVSFGIGAFGVPLVLGLLLQRASYTSIVGGLALLVAVPLVDFAVVRFPPPKQPQGFPLRRVGALLGDATLLLVGLLLFLQSGMEITLGGWSRPVRARGAGAEPGAVDPGAVAVLGRDGGRPACTDSAACGCCRRRPCFRGSWRWRWPGRGSCWPYGAQPPPGRVSSCSGPALRRDSRSC